MHFRFPAVALVLAAALGCSTTPPGPDPDPDPVFTATKVAGDNQTAAPLVELTTILRVSVVEAGNAPAPGRALTWTVATGGGTLSAVSATTNSSGEGTARWTLGPNAGVQTVTVAVAGVTLQLTFSATAVVQGPVDVLPTLVATVPIPANYGIHDTFVRDGLAFVLAWNTGMRIYDVGNGRSGGSPSNPILVSSIVTSANGVAGGAQVHNAWWFHNPVTLEKRYLFIGQEGPASVGNTSSGDIHILDVSDLANPVEVGFIRVPGAGAHNFWMDEARQVLYAAYYNGGVIAVDVSGTLAGDMSSRIVAQAQPGGSASTYVWGVMLAGNTIYLSDMESGFWALDPITLATRGGGFNVPERFGSDLWVFGSWGYSGTWGTRGGVRGNAIKVWALAGNGVPTIADSIIIPDVGTISDVAVTPDGKALVATAENLGSPGLYIFDRATPSRPTLKQRALVTNGGLHTGEIAIIGGRTYVFAAKNPPSPALQIWDITGVVP